MSQLWLKVCDLEGNTIGMLNQFAGVQGMIPWMDSRTGEAVIAMSDPLAKELYPLKRIIKLYYGSRDHPAITGILLKPSYDFAAGTVSISFHDPSIKLKHHYHRFGDIVVDKGFPVDGRGMRRLIESSLPTVNQVARLIPDNHISWGLNVTVDQDPKDEGGIWGKCERGDNVWDSVIELAQKDIGPDFELEPRDDLTKTGHFVRLNVGAKPTDAEGGFPLSVDYTDPSPSGSGLVAFHYGVNAAGFRYDPDGSAVRNHYTAVIPGGPRNRSTADGDMAVYHSELSLAIYGIYESFESVSGDDIPHSLLEADAKGWVRNYRMPPEYFEVNPRQDAPNVPKFMEHFKVGDFIIAGGRRSGFEREVSGRVLQATISQDRPGSRQSTLLLTCAPVFTSDAEAGEA